MSKRVLVLSTTPRKAGNSAALAEQFAKGARDAGHEYEFRGIYLLAAAAEAEETVVEGAEQGLRGWIDCFEQARLCGIVRGIGATAPGDIAKLPDKLQAAQEMEKRV